VDQGSLKTIRAEVRSSVQREGLSTWQALPRCVRLSVKTLGISSGTACAQRYVMAKIESFRDLLVWQKAIDLAVRCHRIARRFPRDEQQVLGYQTRKSSLSMPSNIAEGFARHSTASYIQHLWTAHASGAELQSQLTVGTRIDIVREADAEILIADAEEVGRMIHGLVRSLERTRPT
jgi:four helix bundle protein